MSKPPPPSLEDYDAIEAAVRETERGRWFLTEFARRNRAADTAQILDALASLEARIQAQPAVPSLHPVERFFDDEPVRLSNVLEGDAEVRLTPTLMLAPPPEAEPPEPEVTELAVVPPLNDAPAGLDLDPELETLMSAGEPAQPPASEVRTRVEAELADLAGLRASLFRPDAAPQPPAARPNALAARQPPLLESLSEAEKALLFA